MSLTATYNGDLARVGLAATDAYTADHIVIQRSVNNVQWVTVRGASNLDPASATIDDYEFVPGVINYYRSQSYSAIDALLGTDLDDITPTITNVWLKSVARPFLNMALPWAEEYSTIGRRSRSGLLDIPGRTYPVRIGDVASSRTWTLTARTDTLTQARNLEYLVAAGDAVYVQVPDGFDIPGGYVGIGDMGRDRVSRKLTDDRRRFALPMTNIAAPAATVVGYTATWAGILADFGSWSAVMLAFPTWADVLEYVSDPSVVVVE
jgi:hypothetical protein